MKNVENHLLNNGVLLSGEPGKIRKLQLNYLHLNQI
jgi:hypothetical protein